MVDYRSSNIEAYARHLMQQPWNEWYESSLNVQEKTNIFYQWVNEASATLPVVYVEILSTDKPWLTPLVKHLINCKFEAYRSKNFALFKHFKSKVKMEVLQAKKRWADKMKSNSHGLWKMMKELDGSRERKSALDSFLQTFPSTSSATEAINNSFCHVFSPAPDWTEVVRDLSSMQSEWKVDTSEYNVFQKLRRLKVRKATGSDGIAALILRSCATVFAMPLSHLFSLSICSGELPLQLSLIHI